MLWLNFDKWTGGASRFFVFKRIYYKGYKWTPFIKVGWRKYRYGIGRTPPRTIYNAPKKNDV